MPNHQKSSNKKCPHCGKPYVRAGYKLGGDEYEFPIPACNCLSDAFEAEEEKEEAARRRERRGAKQQELDEITNRYFCRGDDGLITFKTLDRRLDNVDQIKAMEEYLDNLEENINNGRAIGLLGKGSTGKTALMICLHKELVERGVTSALVNWALMFPNVKYISKQERESRNNIIRALMSADVLFLDDLFRMEYGDVNVDELYRLLEHRYPLRAPIFFASNLYGNDQEETKDEMARMLGGGEVSMAIIDRLFCTAESRKQREKGETPRMRILTMTGDPFR